MYQLVAFQTLCAHLSKHLAWSSWFKKQRLDYMSDKLSPFLSYFFSEVEWSGPVKSIHTNFLFTFVQQKLLSNIWIMPNIPLGIQRRIFCLYRQTFSRWEWKETSRTFTFSEMVKKFSDTMDEEGEMFFNGFKPSPSTKYTHYGPDPWNVLCGEGMVKVLKKWANRILRVLLILSL